MARISPATLSRDLGGDNHEEWIYRLEPAQELPLLDLSISIKSRFLSTKWLARFDRFIRHRKLLFSGISIAMLLYPASLLADKSVGKWLAVATSLVGLPAALVGGSLLRYNVVVLLLTTYDVWYFTIMNTATLLVIAMSLGDVRAVSMLVTWVGFQPMVLIDSNLRAIRKLTLITIMGIVGLVFFMALVAFNLIEGIYEFELFRYQSHVFYAKSFVNNGLLTIMLLLARNVLRNRGMFCSQRRKTTTAANAGAVMECVSYRCRLKLRETHSPRTSSIINSVLFSACVQQQNLPVYMQQMRYVPRIRTIDARRTVLPLAFLDAHAEISSSPQRCCWTRLAFKFFSGSGSTMSIIAISFDMYRRANNLDPGSGLFPFARGLALLLTAANCAISLALCQRKLLLAILKAFDFAFFSAHITILHLCMADFFYWRKDCVTLLITWLWFHWALCLDALTPIVRLKIGFHVRRVALFFILGVIVPSVALLFILLPSTSNASAPEIQDRVLFQSEIFHTLVRVRVTPIFYNCLPTGLALAMRFAWRLCTYANDDLLVIDGKVVYNNYFRKTRNRRSRRRSDNASAFGAGTTVVLPERAASSASEQSSRDTAWQ